jgi:hypothetical protein
MKDALDYQGMEKAVLLLAKYYGYNLAEDIGGDS